MSRENKLDIIQGVSLVPWDLNNLGAVFGKPKSSSQCVASRCNFVVRRGFDEAEQVEFGNVIEALGDVGYSLRSNQYAFQISASNLSYKSGTDAPLRAQSLVGNALASLKLGYVQEVKEDRYVGISYDFSQKKPELTLAWAGDTFAEQASLAVTVDPVDRAMKVRAGVTFPGPEWRKDVWDHETRMVQLVPLDVQSRHSIWAEQDLKQGQLMAATKIGARLDIGRLANIAGTFIDKHLEPKIPLLVWRIPFSHTLYRTLVPLEDRDQMRYRIKGWSAEFSHDFSRKGPSVGISKRIGSSDAVVAVTYDTDDDSAGLELRSRWFVAAAKMSRQEGFRQWRNPSVQFLVQPLGFL